MGLFSSVSRLFGGGSTQASPATSAPARTPTDDVPTWGTVEPKPAPKTPTHDAEVATLDRESDDDSTALEFDDDLAELDAPAPERPRPSADIVPETRPTPPAKKSRQELIEELSRNYQEVLELVRKMSDHPDRNEERQQRVEELASKVDVISNALETMPDRIHENAKVLNKEIVDAIDRSTEAEKNALGQVIEHSRKAGETQGKLVTTMADFRETMSDVSKSGTRSNEILAEMSRNANETREEIAQLIVTSKRWTTVAMVASLSIAVVAIVIAVISFATA